ncbi:hypothetical protein I2I11_16465 [Pontibacter sp. 172403-2]|uniref:putative sensor domain DACNV-containing protein n=1 Tax=Pontibacter rufus TaxID=2791028 RepID=UPI0018AF5A9F|nr:hypothetical protein [Pontibacter sp. 172403-2]MBF9254898.1 hypothetical protein [Pontibacter sp. 172403-2]
MTDKATYEAARMVAATTEKHFARHLDEARQLGETDLAPAPPAPLIEKIIDTAFWASLQREEGQPPKISLAFFPPEQVSQPLLFEQRLPFSPGILTKLAPGVERAGIHVGVWHDAGKLYIWGTTRIIPKLCFVVDVSEPGLLVIKHRRIGGFGKFANVAVLKGDQVKVVDEQSASLPDCPALLTTLLGFASPVFWGDPTNVLVQLAVSMRTHGRGGSLLMVPAGTQVWRRSIIQPVKYAISPAFCGLADLMRQSEHERGHSAWPAALQGAIDGLAGLTAVDGATVINDAYELLAFGAKIGRPEGNAPVEKMVVTEPIEGNEAVIIHPAQSGGTRHLSAAQFVHDQRDAIALVASQDGNFTIFMWSVCENMVHAHRVGALLL